MIKFEQHYQVQWNEFRVDVQRTFALQIPRDEIIQEAFEAFVRLAPDFCTFEEFNETVSVSILVHERKAIDCEIDYYTFESET